jgi:hypothetical protein
MDSSNPGSSLISPVFPINCRRKAELDDGEAADDDIFRAEPV